ncbi:RNA polymerase III-inhibiting protein maf1 [Polyrhizophydium stewartii]|uniref:Repressor of RNA polymerase III transcription MAF1 n=1 Tax=Polyrhizophydium stewartii TaxID=2732419 RepID=A0ABR4N5Q4_9FUNG
MKYLQFDRLEAINSQLSCIDKGDARIFGRIEAYSCKNTVEDKKLKLHIESKYDDELALAPDVLSPLLSPISPFGPLSQPASRKTLFFLLATLNAAYPDYDFSDVKPEYFTKLPTIGLAVNSVNNVLLAHLGDAKATDTITTAIWSAIDEAAEVKDCDAYSFNPDRDLEPDAEEGNLWSFYFFFFNRRLKRMIFFTCRSVSSMVPIQPEEDELLMYDAEAEELVDDFRRTRSSQSLSLEQYMMQPFQLDI